MAATILLIDDEPDLLELITDFLEMEDFSVLQASSGAQALEIYAQQQEQISAIISDRNLGDMSGNDILDQLKEQGNYPPFFFSTGSIDYTLEQAQADGASGLFSKPFDMDQLVATLKQALD